MRILLAIACVSAQLSLLSSGRPRWHLKHHHDINSEATEADLDTQTAAATASNHHGGLTIVWDMDETMIHGMKSGPIDRGVTYFQHPWTPDTTHRTVLVRPHIISFLKQLKGIGVRMLVWSAGVADWVDPIIDRLETDAGFTPRELFFARFYYSDMRETAAGLKDLGWSGLPTKGDVSHTVLIDDMVQQGLCQPQNFLPVPPFIGRYDTNDPFESDGQLMQTLRYLHSQLIAGRLTDVRCAEGEFTVGKWQQQPGIAEILAKHYWAQVSAMSVEERKKEQCIGPEEPKCAAGFSSFQASGVAVEAD